MKNKLIVILNDNDMSIAQPVGAMSAYLAKLLSQEDFIEALVRNYAKRIIRYLPNSMKKILQKAEGHGRSFFTGGTLFEELGFYHMGPIDGHNLNHLLPILKNVKSHNDGPLDYACNQEGQGIFPC